MPVGLMKDPDDSDVEEMDQDRESNDSDKSSSKSDDSDSSSDSDGSSAMDEEECERRRSECMEDLEDLEQQFTLLREQLYRERFTQVDSKLFDIRSGRAQEYLQPLQQLQENMKIRTEVAAILKQVTLISINNQVEAEALAGQQHLQSEQQLLYETMQENLETEIRRLEEDKNNVDLSSALWDTGKPRRKSKSKKKPVTVYGPYIVYMIKDSDILHDWTEIKKAITSSNRKSDFSL